MERQQKVQKGKTSQSATSTPKSRKNQNQQTPTQTPAQTLTYTVQVGNELIRPNAEERDKRIDSLKSQIGTLEKDLGQVEDQIRGASTKSDNPEVQKKRDEVIAIIKQLRSELNTKREEKEDIQERIDMVEDERNEMKQIRSNLLKTLPETREDRLEERIREMEFKHKSESLSIPEEKKLIAYIKVLHQGRDSIKRLKEIEARISSGLEQTAALVKQLKAKTVEIGKIREAIQAQNDILDAMKSTNTANLQNKQVLFQKRSQLKHHIDELYAQIRAERDAFKAASNEFYDKLRESQKARQEEYEKRREEAKKRRDAMIDEVERKNKEYFEKKREEERYKRENPFEEQIQICNALIAYLNKYLPKQPKKQEQQPQQGGKKGVQQQGSKGGQQQGNKGSQQQSERPTSGRGTIIKHPIDKFNAFAFVKVAMPSTTDKVATAIKALENRKAEYKAGKPKSKKKVQAAAAEASTSTAVDSPTSEQDAAPVDTDANSDAVATLKVGSPEATADFTTVA